MLIAAAAKAAAKAREAELAALTGATPGGPPTLSTLDDGEDDGEEDEEEEENPNVAFSTVNAKAQRQQQQQPRVVKGALTDDDAVADPVVSELFDDADEVVDAPPSKAKAATKPAKASKFAQDEDEDDGDDVRVAIDDSELLAGVVGPVVRHAPWSWSLVRGHRIR